MHVRRRTTRGRRVLLPAVGLAAVVLATATGSLANSGANTSGPPNIQGEAGTLPNVDNRRGRTAPTQAQRGSVKPGSEARFNKFGAPSALSDPGTYLAPGLPGGDVAAARVYLSDNSELLGLSANELASLELVNAPPIGRGRAVLFRQVFDGLEAVATVS
jgi:extracellular elastinolytic metalloproteinase